MESPQILETTHTQHNKERMSFREAAGVGNIPFWCHVAQMLTCQLQLDNRTKPPSQHTVSGPAHPKIRFQSLSPGGKIQTGKKRQI